MHVETDEDILEMFRKYKDNPHIPIIVYERVDPLKIVKPNETQPDLSKERERPETHAPEIPAPPTEPKTVKALPAHELKTHAHRLEPNSNAPLQAGTKILEPKLLNL